MWNDIHWIPSLLLKATFRWDFSNIENYRLMRVTEDEQFLDAGRFKQFEKTFESPHIVVISCEIMADFAERIEWIADNTVSKWSLKALLRAPLRNQEYVFHFESHVDAVYFALRWK